MPYVDDLDELEVSNATLTNFTNGFSMWHVQWHFPIPDPTTKTAWWSEEFKTVAGKHAELFGVDIVWRLSLSRNDKLVSISLYPTTITHHVPVIFRIGWCNRDSDITLKDARFVVFNMDETDYYADYTVYKLDPKEACDDFTFHCWIAIPNIYWGVHSIYGSDHGTLFRYECLEKISSNFAALFDGVLGKNEELRSLSDVTLAILGKETQNVIRKFYCHRNILMAGSSVFMAMFTKPWQENRDKAIEIKDIDEKSMESVLRYIYTGQHPSNKCDFDEAENLIDVKNLIDAAEKYDLAHLKEWAEAHLILRINTDRDRIQLLQFAQRYRLNKFKTICLVALSTNTAQFEDQQLLRDVPQQFLQELMAMAGKNMWSTKKIITKRDPEFEN